MFLEDEFIRLTSIYRLSILNLMLDILACGIEFTWVYPPNSYGF